MSFPHLLIPTAVSDLGLKNVISSFWDIEPTIVLPQAARSWKEKDRVKMVFVEMFAALPPGCCTNLTQGGDKWVPDLDNGKPSIPMSDCEGRRRWGGRLGD